MLLAVACSSAPPSPEDVVVTYVQLVNQGQLEEAKAWCTPAGMAHLEALAAIMEAVEEPMDAAPVQVEVTHCQAQAKGMRCEVQVLDGYGPHTETYDLTHTPAGWRIDQSAASGATETREEMQQE